jgi:hypothetical protein
VKKAKLITIAFIVTILVITQFAMASAAPSLAEADSITGSIYSVSLVSDDGNDMTVVEITLVHKSTGEYRTVRVTEETAYDLGLLEEDGDGGLVPVAPEFWPESITIPFEDVIPTEEEAQHPVGKALAAYFSELPGVDYNMIMAARLDGYGFGVITQSLWLTQKLEGDSEVLAAILEAKKTGDFSAFTLEDGAVPSSWGQFKKAILDGDKKTNLGAVMSGKEKDNHANNGNGGENGNAENNGNKDKDKDSNGNNGNNGNKDKDKNKP